MLAAGFNERRTSNTTSMASAPSQLFWPGTQCNNSTGLARSAKTVLAWHTVQQQYWPGTQCNNSIGLARSAKTVLAWHAAQKQYWPGTQCNNSIGLARSATTVLAWHTVQQRYWPGTQCNNGIGLAHSATTVLAWHTVQQQYWPGTQCNNGIGLAHSATTVLAWHTVQQTEQCTSNDHTWAGSIPSPILVRTKSSTWLLRMQSQMPAHSGDVKGLRENFPFLQMHTHTQVRTHVGMHTLKKSTRANTQTIVALFVYTCCRHVHATHTHTHTHAHTHTLTITSHYDELQVFCDLNLFNIREGYIEQAGPLTHTATSNDISTQQS